jgi:rhodanese-related sulfurtransferase
MIDKRENFYLINVLDEDSFIDKHIPGSINIPIHKRNFNERLQKEINQKEVKIVVYSESPEDDSGPSAAKKLIELGYRMVYDYEGGIKDWKDAGYSLEEHVHENAK